MSNLRDEVKEFRELVLGKQDEIKFVELSGESGYLGQDEYDIIQDKNSIINLEDEYFRFSVEKDDELVYSKISDDDNNRANLKVIKIKKDSISSWPMYPWDVHTISMSSGGSSLSEELEISDPSEESINGTADRQNKVNKELVKFNKNLEKNKQDKKNAYDSIEKVEDYLYDTYYTKADYSYGNKYFENMGVMGSCSSIRKDNLFGKSHDWKYDESVTFIVHSKVAGRYESLGVSHSIEDLTKDVVESGEINDNYQAVPLCIADGINEKGLCVSVNIVPKEKGDNTIVNAFVEEKIRMHFSMLPRYILDKFSDAFEASSYIRDYVTLYMSAASEYDAHYMISDTYGNNMCIEFVNGETVFENINNNFMTNFHMIGTIFNDDGTVYTPETKDSTHSASTTNQITPHGQGLERFNLINSLYPGIIDEKEMKNALEALHMTKIYDSAPVVSMPYWYTELVGGSLTVDSDVSDFSQRRSEVDEKYRVRTRNGETWQSVHTSVYNMDTLELLIFCQEGSTGYNFNIKKSGGGEPEKFIKTIIRQEQQNLMKSLDNNGNSEEWIAGIPQIKMTGTHGQLSQDEVEVLYNHRYSLLKNGNKYFRFVDEVGSYIYLSSISEDGSGNASLQVISINSGTYDWELRDIQLGGSDSSIIEVNKLSTIVSPSATKLYRLTENEVYEDRPDIIRYKKGDYLFTDGDFKQINGLTMEQHPTIRLDSFTGYPDSVHPLYGSYDEGDVLMKPMSNDIYFVNRWNEDENTWTQREIGSDATNFQYLEKINDRFFAGSHQSGGDPERLYWCWSPAEWTPWWEEVQLPVTDVRLSKPVFKDGVWYLFSSTNCYTSSDLENWDTHQYPDGLDLGWFEDPCVIDGKILIGSMLDGILLLTSDGINFEEKEAPWLGGGYSTGYYENDGVVYVPVGGTIYTTINGYDWNTMPSPDPNAFQWNKMAFIGEMVTMAEESPDKKVFVTDLNFNEWVETTSKAEVTAIIPWNKEGQDDTILYVYNAFDDAGHTAIDKLNFVGYEGSIWQNGEDVTDAMKDILGGGSGGDDIKIFEGPLTTIQDVDQDIVLVTASDLAEIKKAFLQDNQDCLLRGTANDLTVIAKIVNVRATSNAVDVLARYDNFLVWYRSLDGTSINYEKVNILERVQPYVFGCRETVTIQGVEVPYFENFEKIQEAVEKTDQIGNEIQVEYEGHKYTAIEHGIYSQDYPHYFIKIIYNQALVTYLTDGNVSVEELNRQVPLTTLFGNVGTLQELEYQAIKEGKQTVKAGEENLLLQKNIDEGDSFKMTGFYVNGASQIVGVTIEVESNRTWTKLKKTLG